MEASSFDFEEDFDPDVELKVEVPVFVLKGRNGYCEAYDKPITISMLKEANIGDCFYSDGGHIARDRLWQEIEVIYKSQKGIALLFREKGNYDSPEMENYYENLPRLIWVEFI